VNSVDEAPPPENFYYITEPNLRFFITEKMEPISNADNYHPKRCQCKATLEGNLKPPPPNESNITELPAHTSAYSSSGCLFTDKMTGAPFELEPIYECNELCRCDVEACLNRVVQKGNQALLQVFRTSSAAEGKGWGLQTLSKIPHGGYICEYVGEVLPMEQLKKLQDDSYTLILAHAQDSSGNRIGINSKEFGNVGRFINHSCSPNAVAVTVFTHHPSFSPVPRIAFFAIRDILEGEEIAVNYGDEFWRGKTEREPDWKCLCGAIECPHSESHSEGSLSHDEL
jgi:SET domain-containing protein